MKPLFCLLVALISSSFAEEAEAPKKIELQDGVAVENGVIIATDTMGSYGSLARFPDLKRVLAVNKTTIVGYTGDIADFQFLQEQIERKQREEDAIGGGITMKPKALHCWLTRLLLLR